MSRTWQPQNGMERKASHLAVMWGRKSGAARQGAEWPCGRRGGKSGPPRSRGGRPQPNRWSRGVDWPIVAWVVMVHAGALAAPFFFTWKALAVAAFLAWLTGSIGVCMGYHRQLTHGSFCTYRPIRWLFAFIGGLSGEGSALTWVANHRKHHMFSDKEGDPHSPREGKWWSHMLWFMPALGRGPLRRADGPLCPGPGQGPRHAVLAHDVSARRT